MSKNQTDQIKESVEESSSQSGGGLAAEAASQLGDFVSNKGGRCGNDASLTNMINFEGRAFPLSEKERTEAVKNLGSSLDAMVQGDIPHMIARLKELGLSTKELEAKQKELTAKVEAAKPLQDAILKGDIAALQKMVKDLKPEQLQEMTDLIQKHFDKAGLGIEVDFTEGKLILSQSKGDRAIAISKDKLDVIGVNPDGSYDFNRHYRRENPAAELKTLSDNSLSNYMNPPYKHRFEKEVYPLPHDNSGIRQLLQSTNPTTPSTPTIIRGR